jgi:hypothetical protein
LTDYEQDEPRREPEKPYYKHTTQNAILKLQTRRKCKKLKQARPAHQLQQGAKVQGRTAPDVQEKSAKTKPPRRRECQQMEAKKPFKLSRCRTAQNAVKIPCRN